MCASDSEPNYKLTWVVNNNNNNNNTFSEEEENRNERNIALGIQTPQGFLRKHDFLIFFANKVYFQKVKCVIGKRSTLNQAITNLVALK